MGALVACLALLHIFPSALHRLSLFRKKNVSTDNEAYLRSITRFFERHCGWTPTPEFKQSLTATRDYPVPLLVDAAGEHCPSSSLPYTSVDLWYHHADVVIAGTSPQAAERELDERCNNKESGRACIIFVQRPLIHSDYLGAAFLLRVLKRPFVLLTADNDDPCLPYDSVPAAGGPDAAPPAMSPGVAALVKSPLLIRWYSKVRRLID